MKSELEVIGENIRERRQFLNLTQNQLAQLMGVHRTYIGMVERGEKNITISSLVKIAKALQVDPKQLL